MPKLTVNRVKPVQIPVYFYVKNLGKTLCKNSPVLQKRGKHILFHTLFQRFQHFIPHLNIPLCNQFIPHFHSPYYNNYYILNNKRKD